MPRLTQVETDLEGVLPRLTELVEHVAALSERKQRFTQVHWPDLSVDEAAQQWRLLADWVEEILGDWYQLTRGQLPDCWPLHRPAVLELSSLRISYLAAHDRTAIPQLAAEWNGRWRASALANIAAAIPKEWCSEGYHHTSKSEVDKLRAQRFSDRLDHIVRAAGVQGKPKHHWTEADRQRYHQAEQQIDGGQLTPLQEDHRHHPGQEPTRRDYWEPYLRRAVEHDLAWRAQREERKRQKPSPVPRTV
jgi:hypothetical protein